MKTLRFLRWLVIVIIPALVNTAGAWTTWTLHGRGDWNDPDNWSEGVPDADDNGGFEIPSFGTAVVNGGFYLVGTANQAGSYFGVEGGLEINNVGSFSVYTLQLNAPELNDHATVSLSASTLSVTTYLAIYSYGNGTVDFSMSGNSKLQVGGQLQQGSGGTITLDLASQNLTNAFINTDSISILNGATVDLLGLDEMDAGSTQLIVDSNTSINTSWTNVEVGGYTQLLYNQSAEAASFTYNGHEYTLNYRDGANQNQITLTSAAAVPEPSAWAWASVLVLLFLSCQRLRNRISEKSPARSQSNI